MIPKSEREKACFLLVEDSESYARLLTTMLGSAEETTSVKHCTTLKEALESVELEDFSAILLDLVLPDSQGLETVEQMCKHAHGIPIVVLTGNADQTTAINAVKIGAQDFLVKTDVDLDKVWRALRYAMERASLQKEQSLLQRQLIDSVQREQARIGRDLHDGMGQELSGLAMVAKTLARRLERLAPEEADTANLIYDRIRAVLRNVRSVIRGLNPVEVDRLGLPVAIENLCEMAAHDSKIPCQFRSNVQDLDIDSETGTHLFRITQESVNNAFKHGKPSKVQVTLWRSKGRLLLNIQDDGIGCDLNAARSGMGVRTMNYRANLIGATFDVRSTPNVGTIARCSLPLDEETKWEKQ